MMNLNLGKSIFKIVFIIFFIPVYLFSRVSLEAPDSFYKGEQVVFSISASGADVEFPAINKIDDYIVQNAGTSSSTSIINGVRNQSLKRTFAFRPTTTTTIPPFEIKIDGKIFKTKAKTIKAKAVEKTISPNYELIIDVDKKNLFVGESTVLKLIFKYRKDLQIVDLQFAKPTFENFWMKELKSNNTQNSSGDFVIQELNYLLFPQKSGKLIIEPLKIDVVTMDNRYGGYGFFSQTATKTTPVYSNSINLTVKQLPNGIKLIGDFSIDATIDKDTINQGDAVSYKIQIEGRGNLDDIDEIKLNIPNTTIYDNPSQKDYNIKDNKYGGIYTKTYSIVAAQEFVIPPIELNYFDKTTNSIKIIKTKEYKIKVNGVKKQKPQLQVSNTEQEAVNNKEKKIVTEVIKTTDNEKLIYFIFGILSTIVIFIVIKLLNKKEKEIQTPFQKKIKSAKTNNELLNLLVVYINIDKELDKIIFTLEDTKTIKDLKQIKKDVLKIVKDKELKIKL